MLIRRGRLAGITGSISRNLAGLFLDLNDTRYCTGEERTFNGTMPSHAKPEPWPDDPTLGGIRIGLSTSGGCLDSN